MVVGTPDSWDPTISISGKDHYDGCTWSPCGRFIAALSGNAVNIRNQLTLELLTTLQPTETTPPLTGPLAYSPDGRSLACASNISIVIWDIQTGGVAKEIFCGAKTASLVWSLDGRTVGTIGYLSPDPEPTRMYLHIFGVGSGTPLLAEEFRSSHRPHLWAYTESFRIMTTIRHELTHAQLKIEIRISEVRFHLVKIKSFHIKVEIEVIHHRPGSDIVYFSPSTSHVAISVDDTLFIFQDGKPPVLLGVKGHFRSQSFSSDGGLFAASGENGVRTWQYTRPRTTSGENYYESAHKEIWCQDWTSSLQFSPTPSSILIHSKNILQVWHLDTHPFDPNTHPKQYAALSSLGSRVATAYQFSTNIAIIDPHSQLPPQLIDTGVSIEGLLLSSNVLLVVGSNKIVAWLVTEEGRGKGEFDNITLNYSDRIWAISLLSPNRSNKPWIIPLPEPNPKLAFHVEGQIGVIEHQNIAPFCYHTETGEPIQPVQTPLCLSGPALDIAEGLRGRHHLYCHGLFGRDSSPEGWRPSETTLREGWVKDSEGKHRLWLNVEWRKSWELADWCHDITTQFSIVGGQPVIVKF